MISQIISKSKCEFTKIKRAIIRPENWRYTFIDKRIFKLFILKEQAI